MSEKVLNQILGINLSVQGGIIVNLILELVHFLLNRKILPFFNHLVKQDPSPKFSSSKDFASGTLRKGGSVVYAVLIARTHFRVPSRLRLNNCLDQ